MPSTNKDNKPFNLFCRLLSPRKKEARNISQRQNDEAWIAGWTLLQKELERHGIRGSHGDAYLRKTGKINNHDSLSKFYLENNPRGYRRPLDKIRELVADIVHAKTTGQFESVVKAAYRRDTSSWAEETSPDSSTSALAAVMQAAGLTDILEMPKPAHDPRENAATPSNRQELSNSTGELADKTLERMDIHKTENDKTGADDMTNNKTAQSLSYDEGSSESTIGRISFKAGANKQLYKKAALAERHDLTTWLVKKADSASGAKPVRNYEQLSLRTLVASNRTQATKEYLDPEEEIQRTLLANEGKINFLAGANKLLYENAAAAAGYDLSTWLRKVADKAACLTPIAPYTHIPHFGVCPITNQLKGLQTDMVRAANLSSFLQVSIQNCTRATGDDITSRMPRELLTVLDEHAEECRQVADNQKLKDAVQTQRKTLNQNLLNELNDARRTFNAAETFMKKDILPTIKEEHRLSKETAQKIFRQVEICAEERKRIQRLLHLIFS